MGVSPEKSLEKSAEEFLLKSLDLNLEEIPKRVSGGKSRMNFWMKSANENLLRNLTRKYIPGKTLKILWEISGEIRCTNTQRNSGISSLKKFSQEFLEKISGEFL